MATITTKFSIGDVVYYANITTTTKRHPCPDCNGSRKWKALSPAGGEYEFGCPRCNTSYHGKDDLRLEYAAYTPAVRQLTIGSIRHDSHGRGNEYMCEETGVGSGSIYSEDKLFAREDEAEAAAEIAAAHANTNTEWVAKRYDRSLEISDYQLGDAALKRAEETERRARSLLYSLSDLFKAIEDAEDKEAVTEAVHDYREWHWKADLARLSDSNSRPQGEDSRSEAECEARQSGLREDGGIAHA